MFLVSHQSNRGQARCNLSKTAMPLFLDQDWDAFARTDQAFWTRTASNRARGQYQAETGRGEDWSTVS